MEGQPNPPSPFISKLKLLLKIVVTIVCLWYVFSRLNFKEIWAALKTVNWFWLFLALTAYTLSKIIGAKRLLIYFKNIGIQLPEWQNIKLYWLGMFYNLFLPGAITGDAYKVVLLSKKYAISYKKTTTAVLLDRFSGLLSLGLIVAVYSSFVFDDKKIILVLIAGALLAIPLLYFSIKKLFPDFLSSFWPTFFWGALVQLSILFCVYCILYALNITSDTNSYVFIFLIAVVASVLPISVGGGLGVREFVIIEGARYAGLEQHTALVLSILFYLVTVICSSAGMIYVFRNPFKNKSAI
jgi:glycosyltransferase 2 family protein